MREHLYRAKAINRDPNRIYRTDYKNGDWVFGLLSKLDKYGAEMTNEDGVSGIDVDPETICEFVDLTDKNGKKIFEGDIVKYKYGRGFKEDAREAESITECIEVVRFRKGGFTPYAYSLTSSSDNKLHFSYFDFEIIGNIYDNPELLEGSNG